MDRRPNVVVTREIPKPGLDLLREVADVWINPEDAVLARKELLSRAAEADGILGLPTDRIDGEFFDAAPRLKGYANYAVGFDNIDVPEATRRGIPVSNTPDVLTTATAELTWALVCAVARHIVPGDADMRAGRWPGFGPLQYLGLELSGLTLGIYGPGRIGTAVAKLSRGYDMPIVTCGGRRPNETLARDFGATRLSFEDFLAAADVIVITAPLNAKTRHAFDDATFARMKQTAILVNSGRGPIVDEAALVRALDAGRIAGAGLDVYEFEPRLTKGLAALPNVVLTPHIGSATKKAREAMSVLAARNLLAMLAGQTPPTCLNPEVLGGTSAG